MRAHSNVVYDAGVELALKLIPFLEREAKAKFDEGRDRAACAAIAVLLANRALRNSSPTNKGTWDKLAAMLDQQIDAASMAAERAND